MLRAPFPDPFYPVVWADKPDAPDTPSTPTTGAAALMDDDHPIQRHLDEALVRKADNDTVGGWKAFSGPWFDARGEEAAARWEDVERGLNEIVRRPLGELATTRQRNMYRDLMGPRLAAWGGEARAHAERETQAFNDAESQRRQDLAVAAMGDSAALNDMRAFAQGERRIADEVRGRSWRQRLDPDAASAAEAEAMSKAYAAVVERLSYHDPQQARLWLDRLRSTFREPDVVERLERLLRLNSAEQLEQVLTDSVRGAPRPEDESERRIATAGGQNSAMPSAMAADSIRFSDGPLDGTAAPVVEYRTEPPAYHLMPNGEWVFGRYEGEPGSGEAHFQEYEDPDLAAWEDATSFALDMAPALGSLKSADQVITGRDPVSGEAIDRSWELAGLALGLVPAGKLVGKGARALARRLGSELSVEEHVAKFMAIGFTRKQAEHLAKPYEGMGHHFMPRRWGLPKWFSESSFNVLKPKDMTRGDFYELHFKVDPQFRGARMPKRLGPGWSGKRLGLKEYGRLGRLWHGSPRRLKAAVGGTTAAGAGGTYLYEESDDD